MLPAIDVGSSRLSEVLLRHLDVDVDLDLVMMGAAGRAGQGRDLSITGHFRVFIYLFIY